MAIVLIFITAVIQYRILISIPLFQSKELAVGIMGFLDAQLIASMTSAVLNLILILSMERVSFYYLNFADRILV